MGALPEGCLASERTEERRESETENIYIYIIRRAIVACVRSVKAREDIYVVCALCGG